MNTKQCKRILLSGEEHCRVVYCEECGVAELEVGALSLRLEVEAFETLHKVMQQAVSKLQALSASREVNQFLRNLGNVH
ncbi:hypothetical protein ED236_03245 [Pseudomethylobacillus aquaticus]|uniref:Uncharacterized protein n=1 Tax=Pseudomethylobacillus aquaticus TaxID=2676064 RepID=A0A3N0V6Z2_9PROT|nr:hypothetical protein [Pseudomethylobacillus aquaticus]ROH88479.1 hypothetical protein ED236_03245 [Pseudomethylobacillus aquaticus]